MGFVLRDMTESDILQVVSIEKQSFVTPWSEYAFQCELKNKDRAVWQVLAPERAPEVVVGYSGYWRILDEAHINNIAIKKDHRGRRLGRKLMEETIKRAISQGLLNITLEVRESNYIAISLYESLGFNCVGIRKGYYADTGEDALIMWLYVREKEGGI
jgi:ribosomal-protein-alanine N-acetyltransferase